MKPEGVLSPSVTRDKGWELAFMEVVVTHRQQALAIAVDSVQAVVRAVLAKEGCGCDEVAVYFVSQAEISQLHEEHFQDPTPTDCISFPMDSSREEGGYWFLGEVFVCPEVAVNYAASRGEDPYREVMLYVIHGVLHLLGMDDQEPSERRKMRRRERLHLAALADHGLAVRPA